MHIVLISTPIGFLGSGKGGGVEITLDSVVFGLANKGHFLDVVAPMNSKIDYQYIIRKQTSITIRSKS